MGKIEVKTVAATWGAFLASGAAMAVLEGFDLTSLPDWIEVPAGMVVTSVVTFLAGYRASHRPGKLSVSALSAARRSTE